MKVHVNAKYEITIDDIKLELNHIQAEQVYNKLKNLLGKKDDVEYIQSLHNNANVLYDSNDNQSEKHQNTIYCNDDHVNMSNIK